MSNDRSDRVLKLWDYGLDTSAISERLGISRTIVRRELRTAGVDLATSPRQRYDSVGGGRSGIKTGVKLSQ